MTSAAAVMKDANGVGEGYIPTWGPSEVVGFRKSKSKEEMGEVGMSSGWVTMMSKPDSHGSISIGSSKISAGIDIRGGGREAVGVPIA